MKAYFSNFDFLTLFYLFIIFLLSRTSINKLNEIFNPEDILCLQFRYKINGEKYISKLKFYH